MSGTSMNNNNDNKKNNNNNHNRIHIDINPILQDVNHVIQSGFNKIFYDITYRRLNDELEHYKSKVEYYKNENEICYVHKYYNLS